MILLEAINLKQKEMITFVGAGGKTSTMYRLSQELKRKGKKVLITTTTAIYDPPREKYDHRIASESLEEIIEKAKNIEMNTITVLASRTLENGKLKGLPKEWLDFLYKENSFDYILVEGDGSKRKPIKAPADHEPVIPKCTSILVGLIGFDVYGKKIDEEWVHRLEKFIDIVKKPVGSPIEEDEIVKLVISDKGLFKDHPIHCEKVLLFNKVEERDIEIAIRIGESILREDPTVKNILMGRMIDKDPIKKILG